MTGLFLLFVAAVWFALSVAMAYAFTSQIKIVPLRAAAASVVCGVLLGLPLIDEFIGKQQFESLCQKYSTLEIDEQHAMNRRVVLVEQDDQVVADALVPMRIQPWRYKDAETGQVLVSYHTLRANGGWLIRTLGISETNSPLLFRRACGPADQFAFKKKFNITVIN